MSAVFLSITISIFIFIIILSLSRSTRIPMSQIIYFTVCLLCFSLVIPRPVTAGDTPTAYDLLQSYGFPIGILPKGVKGYDLDKTTGKFNLHLNVSCSFSLEGSYQIKYKSTISGHVANKKLTDLNGISVKIFFVWLNIVEVDRSGDELEFSVGIASANFPVDNFEICPQCGCGMDCNGQVRKMKSNPFVSSI